jgi:hypothetical protein
MNDWKGNYHECQVSVILWIRYESFILLINKNDNFFSYFYKRNWQIFKCVRYLISFILIYYKRKY